MKHFTEFGRLLSLNCSLLPCEAKSIYESYAFASMVLSDFVIGVKVRDMQLSFVILVSNFPSSNLYLSFFSVGCLVQILVFTIVGRKKLSACSACL